MKFQSLKAQSAMLALSLLALCGTFTSCVEDEENPFRDDDYDEEYAQLPGNGEFYIGSIVEMRGRGFLPSDQVWVKDYSTGLVQQARTTNCTGDKLFFVVPGGLTPNNSVEVSITQGDDTEIIGNLYLSDYNIGYQTSNWYDNAYDITVSGEYSDGDKLYFQERYTDDNTGETILLGEPVEAEIRESEGNFALFTVFPLYTQYQVTFVHNGETAKTQTMNNYDLVKFTESASAGQQVTLRWRGFRSSDAILLINPYTQYGERVSTTCDATGLTFTVPASYQPGSYEIVIARYDNEKIPALVIGTLNVY